MISTGIKHLDRLISGIKLGDNVVWQIANAVPVEYFIKSFFSKSNDFQNSIIYINFNYSPHTICKRFDDIFKSFNFILIDAFTNGKGNGDPVFLDFYHNEEDYDLSRIVRIEDPRDINGFIATLNEVQKDHRDGSFYIFDSLTGMNELWRDERSVLDFFAFTCPKLYEMNTIAYWILEQEAHSKEFIAGLTHITQIVLSVYNTSADHYALKIHKLEDRPSTNISTPHGFRIIDREISFEETAEGDLFKIGTKVKELRKAAGITQAGLALRLGMTPGAVSQIENDLITPSLNTLVHLAGIFQRPIEYFIGAGLLEDGNRGFSIFRKKDARRFSSKNALVTGLSDEKRPDFAPYHVTLAGRESIDGPILMHKGKEFIVVVNGTLSLTIDDEEHLLRKGDSIILERSFIERWTNHGKTDCEFVYIQY